MNLIFKKKYKKSKILFNKIITKFAQIQMILSVDIIKFALKMPLIIMLNSKYCSIQFIFYPAAKIIAKSDLVGKIPQHTFKT